jgi:hypothetical protein
MNREEISIYQFRQIGKLKEQYIWMLRTLASTEHSLFVKDAWIFFCCTNWIINYFLSVTVAL